MHPLERYLRRLREIHATGAATKETSYYAPLEALLNAAGQGLSPRVLAVFQLKDLGAGRPDGGLYTAGQIQQDAAEPLPGQLPERGVVEVKSPGESIDAIARGEQVAKYWEKYGQVLVTNYRQFAFVGKDIQGHPMVLDAYTLADSEEAFWEATQHPDETVAEHGTPLMAVLERVLLHAAPLVDPKDVAWFLASYARDARLRLEQANIDRLNELRAALEEALGIQFSGDRGERFFQATVIQTLFYGIFSAWVLWHREDPLRRDLFTWHSAAYLLQVPVMRVLFERVAMPSHVRHLDLVDLLNRTARVLNRVDRGAFFEKFEDESAIQYFYEPFLEAYNPTLRRELGVWYTPREVVRYMVHRVDTVLRETLGRPDGLADPAVYVLDPCCGTGAYLVEVLRVIREMLEVQGLGALVGAKLKEAATTRLFGFEILTAPFVVAHLQLGLYLRDAGVPMTGEHERAGVYLTNALTGWEPPEEAKQLAIPYPELREEHDAAEHVKRDVPILVILGNPPYSGYPGMAVGDERSLTEAYRTTVRAPKPQGQGLNDLYVRFFRMAERQITERTGRGVVCFISNYSWLDGLSHPGMRERYLDAFDHIWIDNLHGDKYRTGKTTPEGDPDPSIFSTRYNREGIQVGTAVALLARDNPAGTDTVYNRDLWGKDKTARLVETANLDGIEGYEAYTPPVELGYPFSPRKVEERYLSWPLLTDLFPEYFPGVKTSRDDAVVDVEYDALEKRMRQYFDPGVSNAEMQKVSPRIMQDTSQFDAQATRKTLLKHGFNPDNIIRFYYRPFDLRWLYWEGKTRLIDRSRPEYFPHIFDQNNWLSAAQTNRRGYSPPVVTSAMCSLHVIERGTNLFPLYLSPDTSTTDLFNDHNLANGQPRPNLSDRAAAYVNTLNGNTGALFFHTLAVLHAPSYREENAGALRQDWPRVPLPSERDLLDASAALGHRLAALLDVEQAVEGVTRGAIDTALRGIATPTHIEDKQVDPHAGHLDVTARWGYLGHVRQVMPAKGRLETRSYTDEERSVLDEDQLALLGETTCDVYLNDKVYWKNLPANVWDYTIGGYQVIKKWLSYRELDVLGRPLKIDEVLEVQAIARRIVAILLLSTRLDVNYFAVKSATYAGPVDP